MQLVLREVNTARERENFIKFPLKLYKDNPYFVPPIISGEKEKLDRQKNPAYDFCESKEWVVTRNGDILGRIGGIINQKYIERWDKPYLRFNMFDFVDDEAVGNLLFDAVEGWGREKGLSAVIGPYGFTNLEPHGMLVEGYDELATSTSNYNYPYYKEFIESRGYKKCVDWVEYRIKVPDRVPEKLDRIADIAMKRSKLRVVNLKGSSDMVRYKDAFFRLLNRSYEGLTDVVPLTGRQIEYIYNSYFKFLNPEYMCLVVDETDEMAAFGISVPSLSIAMQKASGKLFPTGFFHLWRAMRRNDTIDLMLVGVRPDLIGKGANAILFKELIPRYIKHGIRYVESTQNMEDNERVQAQWKYFDYRQHKRARCYLKEL
jgi:hypothetical protein